MATYNETGSGGGLVGGIALNAHSPTYGGAKVGGCAALVYVKTYTTKYGAGDIVYSLPKAKRGILERVVIRRVNALNSLLTQGAFEVMYVDTLNSLWNEWDLVSHADALAIAKSYYEALLEDWEEVNKC